MFSYILRWKSETLACANYAVSTVPSLDSVSYKNFKAWLYLILHTLHKPIQHRLVAFFPCVTNHRLLLIFRCTRPRKIIIAKSISCIRRRDVPAGAGTPITPPLLSVSGHFLDGNLGNELNDMHGVSLYLGIACKRRVVMLVFI